ncbi:hypothetical protein [Methylobrevis albus]|uniref:Uncharacterized protein n=1 Tax=Methylobrevis albus TaxID=2793297 RepID=A0A931MXL3_9HYPH|nr:hypothetical protein [Methylobrevis albus]MBH0237307.1 hypothetical protein [Methylobrevis albus]
MQIIGRLFAAGLGFLAAVLAAAVFLLVAEVGTSPENPVDADWFWGLFVVSSTVTASAIGAYVATPALVAILISEIFAIRSWMAFAALGGALGLTAASSIVVVSEAGSVTGVDATVLTAAGLVGGLAYWAVAGRTAGLRGR